MNLFFSKWSFSQNECLRWRRRLLAWEEDSVRECSVLLNNIILQDHIQDLWRWMLDPIHGYSARGTYRFLTSTAEPVMASVINNVWHKLVPLKVSLFAWRLLQDRIPTKSNLVRRHILQANDNLCVGGCGIIATADHLLIGCDLFGNVWFLVCPLASLSFFQELSRITFFSLFM